MQGKSIYISGTFLSGRFVKTEPVIYSEPSQTSMMEIFLKIVNYLQPLNIFANKTRHRFFVGSQIPL